jgi:hypothetical protein
MAYGITGAYVILVEKTKRKREKFSLGKKQDIRKRMCVMCADSLRCIKHR